MGDQLLLIEVRLYDDRWHGAGEWPPSPFRLFQALLASAHLGRGQTIPDCEIDALQCLANLGSPEIAVPTSCNGRGFTYYVPNNDLDAVGGCPANVAKIRAGKTDRPHLLDGGVPFLYLWRLDDVTEHVAILLRLANRLHQFGRGVDPAYARAEIVSAGEGEARLAAHPGSIWRPTQERAGGGNRLRCPGPDTLASLKDRHAAQMARLRNGALRQPPPPRYRTVAYDCPATMLLFDLTSHDPQHLFSPWPLTGAAELALAVRDAAAARLRRGQPTAADQIDRVLIGYNATEADKAVRVRIIPLPSIGSAHVDQSIRRVLLECPPDCCIQTDDLAWAVSGLDLGVDYTTGQVLRDRQAVLAPSGDRTMLGHYGIEPANPVRTWRTVTPAALPTRRANCHLPGSRRSANEAATAHAVRQALRHAGIAVPVENIRVQREPFFATGARVEAFAAGSRFTPDRLWHLEITFSAPIAGPLLIGDGRYCGLGLMAPAKDHFRDVLIFPVRNGFQPLIAERAAVLAAVRRALMSRAKCPDGKILTLFSGHERDSSPACSGQHRHIYLFADDRDADGLIDTLAVVAPWRIDRTWVPTHGDRELFERIVADLSLIRAGSAGLLRLQPPREPSPGELHFGHAPAWTTYTRYLATHHLRRGVDPTSFVTADIEKECLRRGLPRPTIDVTRIHIGARGSISVEARLRFAVAVAGPIMLGRDAHCGGGLFIGERPLRE